MSGADSQSSIANISPTRRYGHAEQAAAENDLVTEGEFRRSVLKVSPGCDVRRSHLIPTPRFTRALSTRLALFSHLPYDGGVVDGFWHPRKHGGCDGRSESSLGTAVTAVA